MQIYREVLPNSYLVILVESTPGVTDTGLLRNALRQASRSGKAQVWLDCSGLTMLPSDMVVMLTRYAMQLRRRHTALVVCHPPTTSTGASLEQAGKGALLVANTLLDAELAAAESVSRVG